MTEAPTHHRAIALLMVVCIAVAASALWHPSSTASERTRDAGRLERFDAGQGSGATRGPIDPNTASLRDLESLPFVGPALAQRIATERVRRPFVRVDDLGRVRGIGPRILARLRPHVSFTARTPNAAGAGPGFTSPASSEAPRGR